MLYTTTHDTETLKGYIDSSTDEELEYLYDYLGVDRKDIGSDSSDAMGSRLADEIIRSAYMSCADVVIVPIQDLLGLGNEARMNFPSTVGNNWRWRMLADQLEDGRRAWIRNLAAVYRR